MTERHITVQRRMAASPGSVWALFADFPHLASHWSGLWATSAIGNQTSGVGARRHVKLKPVGSMEETVTTWQEGRRIDTENHPSVSVPFNRAETTLTLEPDGQGTLATFDYRYVPRGGPIGRFTGPLIDKMLTATFTEMLAALCFLSLTVTVSRVLWLPARFGCVWAAAGSPRSDSDANAQKCGERSLGAGGRSLLWSRHRRRGR
jgi:uncharacterized protein YndB with AHSA1/START domain